MDDLISRQAAIEALDKMKIYRPLDSDRYVISDCLNKIINLPSAQQWRVIEKRPMTEDERKEWSERLGYDIEYDEAYFYSNLPDDGQDVLVSTRYGRVYMDTFCQDEGCYFKENGDMDGIVAWMPKPEPYKGAET